MSAFDQDRNLGPDVGVVEEEEEDEEDMEIVKPSFAKRMAEALLASSSSSKVKSESDFVFFFLEDDLLAACFAISFAASAGTLTILDKMGCFSLNSADFISFSSFLFSNSCSSCSFFSTSLSFSVLPAGCIDPIFLFS